MSAQREPSTGFVVFGLVLFAGPGIAFEAILYFTFGWQIAALPILACLIVLGYRIVWVPVDGSGNGSAGTREPGAGMRYMVELNPEDPDAGVPRKGA